MNIHEIREFFVILMMSMQNHENPITWENC
jgi:hypothetical protein